MVDFTAPLPPATGEAAEPMSARRPRALSVVVVDDHAAVRLGLTAAISSRPGLVCVGAVPDGELLPALLYRARPDVVVLDYELPRVNGLELCRRIKADVPAPAVVLYSAYADQALTIPALVAGVDAMVHKGAPAVELFAAIEAVAAGETLLPAPVPELAEAAGRTVDAADRRLLELLVRQTPRPDVATQLDLSQAELALRVDRMVERLARRAR
jgi:DNA-binding NarL/FixJ family response regulator